MIKKVWKFFCSVKLTVVLFVLILIPSIIGTIIQQNAPDPSKYAEIYGPVWNGIFRYLGFYDIYHDLRFIILLVLLGLNTFACTLNRFKLRWNRLGMMLTHFGLLLILVGALSGAILGVKGFMIIREGETTDQMRVGQATSTMETLPFDVKLVDFILDKYAEPTDKLLMLDVKTNRQESYKVEEGKSVPLPQPSWVGLASLVGIRPELAGSVHVDRVIPNAVTVTSLTEGPEPTGIPAMEFHITGEGAEWRGFALSQLERPYVLERAHLGVGYIKLASGESIDEQVRKVIALSKSNDRLEVTVTGESTPKTYPAQVGSKFNIEGSDYSVEVLRYVPDFVIDTNTRQITSRSNSPNNPAVQVRITGPSGSKEMWLFSRFPGAHTMSDAPIQIRYGRNDLLGGISDFALLLDPASGKPVLAQIREGKLVAKTDVELGQPIGIEGTSYGIVVDRLFENANMVRNIESRPDRSNRAAMEVSVKQRGRPSKSYDLWQGAPADVDGYKMLFSSENTIRDFYSILQIIDGGSMVEEKKIEVNDPLRYKGYSFYQNSYDTEALSWSGLEIKKDPGVPLVYAGFSMQILGMIIIFYINPLVRKAKKSPA